MARVVTAKMVLLMARARWCAYSKGFIHFDAPDVTQGERCASVGSGAVGQHRLDRGNRPHAWDADGHGDVGSDVGSDGHGDVDSGGGGGSDDHGDVDSGGGSDGHGEAERKVRMSSKVTVISPMRVGSTPLDA